VPADVAAPAGAAADAAAADAPAAPAAPGARKSRTAAAASNDPVARFAALFNGLQWRGHRLAVAPAQAD
jgi:hypothetical protein